LLSDYIVVKIIVEIIVWYSVALLDYVFGFLHHIQGFWSRKNYELVMHYYRLDIDAAFVVIFLKMHFISRGVGAFLKLLLTNENISKDNGRQSKLAMNTP